MMDLKKMLHFFCEYDGLLTGFSNSLEQAAHRLGKFSLDGKRVLLTRGIGRLGPTKTTIGRTLQSFTPTQLSELQHLVESTKIPQDPYRKSEDMTYAQALRERRIQSPFNYQP